VHPALVGIESFVPSQRKCYSKNVLLILEAVINMAKAAPLVDVNYQGKIIQGIVNYIYTDEVPASAANTDVQQEKADKSDHNDASQDACDLELVHFLVALMDACEYFSLSALSRMIELSTKELMLKKNNLATFFMAACAPDCDATKGLQDTALGLVKKDPKILIHGTKSVVAMIHPSYMEEILKQEKLPMTEHSCFQLLQAWATAEVASPEDDNDIPITSLTETTNDGNMGGNFQGRF
jgi:hypothetical protein